MDYKRFLKVALYSATASSNKFTQREAGRQEKEERS